MPSYVVTGASRGLGYEFIRQLSQNSSNVVIGLVRNKIVTDERLAKDGIKTVTIIEADVTSFAALQKAAEETAKLTGGRLDYLINNAAFLFPETRLNTLIDYENDAQGLEDELSKGFAVNVVGVSNTVTAFLPLIKESKTKKVITISTGMADLDVVNTLGLGVGTPYSVSKGALNVLVAKYSAAYAPQGILFLSISPGMIDTYEGPPRTAEELAAFAPLIQAFEKHQPSFTGPITPEESVKAVLKVADGATVEKDAGTFVSHHGNKTWL
ncbi:NAD(P)-binding protein [Tothia fuscella]|uniref:NAD(P)-binding protein n=1 Tax=Tothia fuscella TaxID=1048955 RepID=A0A9P4TZ70_9PEZI|nr:NAD(P)-binding protein [Tothia fuscella]